MTTYNKIYFDKTPGLVNQLVLSILALEKVCLRAKDRRLNNAVNYASGAVSRGIAVDLSPDFNALSMIVTLPITENSLVRRKNFIERISVVTADDIGSALITLEPTYPINPIEYLVPAEPTYLAGERDVLERRIAWLAQTAINYQAWLTEWDYFANVCTIWLIPSANGLYPLANRANFVKDLILPLVSLPLDSSIRSLNGIEFVEGFTDYLIEQYDSGNIPYRVVREDQWINLFSNFGGELLAPVTPGLATDGNISSAASEQQFVDALVDNGGSSGGFTTNSSYGSFDAAAAITTDNTPYCTRL